MSPSSPGPDAIVVGAGPAGCVAAARLCDSGRRTLVIEAGAIGPHPNGTGPAGLVSPRTDPTWFWPPLVERGGRTDVDDGQAEYWSGRGVGGGSAVNGLVLQPGDRTDYDRWADLTGCAGWQGRMMEPWIERAVAVLQPEVRSAVGNDPEGDNPPSTATIVGSFDAVVHRDGLQSGGSTLDGDQSGLLVPALATRDGRRRTAAEAYLAPRRHSTLTMECGLVVRRLLVDRGHVVGVELDDGTSRRAPLVVLAAGAIGSPLLLRRSGLAPKAGLFLKNHPSVALGFQWPAGGETGAAGAEPGVHRVVRWSALVDGGPELGQPPGLELTASLMGPWPGPVGPTGTLLAMLSVVRSEGRLALAGDPPVVESNRLSNDHDRRLLTQGFRRTVAWGIELARELGLGPLTAGNPATLASELLKRTDDDVGRWLRQHPGPTYHAAGTCRMGPGHGRHTVTASEIGEAGTVPGVRGVVVVDASLFPDLVSGGLQLPVIAVAERIMAETVLPAA